MTAREVRWSEQERRQWGEGVWTTEPDRREWADATTGLPCMAQRGPLGSLCGYVGIPPGHRLHGLEGGSCAGNEARAVCPVEPPYDWDSWPAREEFTEVLRESAKKMQEISREHGWNRQQHCEHSPESLLSVHGGVTFSGAGLVANQETYQQWCESMHRAEPDVEKYPEGDAAREWRHTGHLLTDYAAWTEYIAVHVIGLQDRPELWWFGFDCAHSGDLIPGMVRLLSRHGRPVVSSYEEVYRTMAYVVGEVTALAHQLAALRDPPPRRLFATEDV